MLYDLEDRQVISRTMARKSLETAAMSADRDLSDGHREVIIQQLARDINRCQIMLRMADNDFSTAREDIESLVDDHLFLPPALYQEYMDHVSPDAREDEGKYMWLFSYMVANLPYLADGLTICDTILSGTSPLSYKDTVRYIKTRCMFDRMMDYCTGMDDVEGVPYSKAREFAQCCSEECSIMLRIGGGKEVPSDEICFHLEWEDVLSMDPFEKICVPEMDQSEHELWQMYCRTDVRRMGIMYARCFANRETEGIISDPVQDL